MSALWKRLVDDASMFPPELAAPAVAVAAHTRHRGAGYADYLGPLVVTDTALAEVAAAARDRFAAQEGDGPLEVSVVNSAGAGGLVAISEISFPKLRVVTVESAVRDLDDVVGNTRRIAVGARELAEQKVFLELPYVPGWERAVEVVEAAGLLAKIRIGGTSPEHFPAPAQLADQISVLVAAGLQFKASAGLQHALPRTVASPAGELRMPGLLNLLLAISLARTGAPAAELTRILELTDPSDITTMIKNWTPTEITRVRKCFHSFSCGDVIEPLQELSQLRLITGDELEV